MYDNLSESLKTVVEYNNEGYPERIITDSLIYIIDGYANNICTVSLLDKNGTYYSFDSISVPQLSQNNEYTSIVDMPKDVLTSWTGTFLDHIGLIANSKLMTLVETMDGVTFADEVANLNHFININGIAKNVFKDVMIDVVVDAGIQLMPEQTRDELKATYLTFKLIKDGFKTAKSCSAAFAAIAAIPATASASLVAAVPLSILCVWNVYTTMSSVGGVINAWQNVDWILTNNNSCSVTATLDGGTLVISGSGALCQSEIDKYKPTYSNAYTDRRSEITKLIIGSGVTSIPDNAFAYYNSLTDVTLSDGKESLNLGYTVFYGGCCSFNSKTIETVYYGRNLAGSTAPFNDMEALKTVTFGSNITSIPANSFQYCPSLKTINKWNNVTEIGASAFYNCTNLTNISFPSTLKTIGSQAFSRSGLTSVTIPNNVISIGDNAFSYCNSLTDVTLSDGKESLNLGYTVFYGGCCSFNSKTIETVYYGRNLAGSTAPFNDMESLKVVTFGSNITLIPANSFENCPNLTTVNKWNNVTEIGASAFYNCTNLINISFPNTLKTIGSQAFGRSGLTSITSNATTPPTLQSNTFYNVSRNIPVYVNCNYLSAYQSTQYWSDFTNYQCAVQIVPASNSAVVTFPEIDNATNYTLSIYSDENHTNSVVEVNLDANGKLKSAPAQNALKVATTLSYTVSGLSANTRYYYSLTPYNASGNMLTIFTGDFTTTAAGSSIENIVASQVSIFPNPAKHEIFIKSEFQIEKVEIYSLAGRLMISENNFNEKISISDLPQGVYLLKVYSDKGLTISKIVKE